MNAQHVVASPSELRAIPKRRSDGPVMLPPDLMLELSARPVDPTGEADAAGQPHPRSRGVVAGDISSAYRKLHTRR
ncbi:hypothetical protein [Streptomyces sp. MST-110588]|uniref:hypothetical protein n=1 Tax=Streptomyces sp. MST-110588 TaxID=2833628 RepID=UPI001F5DBEBA|nr:hypothetical protein [Streptomyces sp. MST-110588]UNO38378.1 hypothetical protein KGS77_00320 [Streptomyces sp. MST-110588]